MGANDSISVIVANDLDIKEDIGEIFKDVDSTLREKIIGVVSKERLRCINTVFNFRWYATHKLEDIAREIAEGAHAKLGHNCRKNGKDCN